MRLLMMACVLSFTQSILLAQDAVLTNKPVPAAKVDFGPAFEKLVQLGLPDTRGATYVKLTLQVQPGSGDDEAEIYSRMRMGYSGGSRDMGAKGNAWLLAKAADDKEGVSTLIFQNYDQIQVTKKVKRSGLLRALIGPGKKSKAATGKQGDWVQVECTKDVKKMISTLDDMKGENKAFDPDRWDYDKSGATVAAEVLVRACQMYRAGFKAEGNQLAKKVLGMVPDPEMIIDQAVDAIASRKYTALVNAFYKDHDWKAYHAGLLKLSEQFPRGWKQNLAVRLLLPQVEKRVKGEQPKMVPIKGVTLKPEVVAIFDAFLNREKPVVVSLESCWLLKSDKPEDEKPDEAASVRRRYGYRDEAPTEEWLKKIYAMRLDGFIGLIAYSTDEHLIPAKLKVGSSSYYSRSYYSSSSDSPEELALREYQSMDRPCSRGEIARKLILATLPDPDSNLGELLPSELRDVAYQWWVEHRYDSPSKLARHFMQTGDNGQRRIAVQSLIASGRDEDSKMVEDYILNSDSVSENLDNVSVYLKARKGKAKEFFKKFSVALKDEAASGDDFSGGWQLREEGGVDKYLKSLSVYIDEVTPEQLIKDMRSGRKTITEGLAMLTTAIGDDDKGPYVPEMISLARKEKALDDQLAVFNILLRWNTRGYYEERPEGDEEEGLDKEQAAKVDALIAKSKDDWEYLLSKKEKPATPEDAQKMNGAPSLAHYASWLMEYVYFPDHMMTLRRLSQFMTRDELWEFSLTRAQDVLEKGSAAPFPDAKNITPARRKEIRDGLATLDSMAVLAYQEKLNLEEKLAWPEVIAEFGKNLPEGVANLNKMVVKIDWTNGEGIDADFEKKFTELTLHKPIDQALIDGVLAFMLEHAATHHDLLLMVGGSGQPGQGVSISCWRGDRAVRWKRNILSEGVSQLVEDKTKFMAGLSLRDSGDEDSPTGGAIYKPDKDVTDEKPAIKKSAEFISAQLTEGKQVSFYFYCESAENLKKLAEQGDDEDDGF